MTGGRARPFALEAEPDLVPADYGGACLSEVVPTLLNLGGFGSRQGPSWLPEPTHGAPQAVLVVLDGLGWDELRAKAAHAPFLSAMVGGPITSVVPSTTATALTSLVTGSPPATHGLMGYRIKAAGEVLNVLRWTTPSGDARDRIAPQDLQEAPAFLGRRPPAVVRAEFAGSGFTNAHLAGVPLHGWRMPSSIALEVASLANDGAPFIYVYYDGIDKMAHETGLGAHFDAELAAADALVAGIHAVLPAGCALFVTADHGQVEVLDDPIEIEKDILDAVVMLSGEGRFRWLHCAPGATEEVVEACAERYGDLAWVATRDELEHAGLFGGPLRPPIAERLGDVALMARAPIAFYDPADTGELRLVARHGSLTRAEMYVPFIARMA